jgi:hypothetical protein
MGTIVRKMRKLVMTSFTEIFPFLPTVGTARGDRDRAVVNLLPCKKDIWGPMRFMAIGTGQDVGAALSILIR